VLKNSGNVADDDLEALKTAIELGINMSEKKIFQNVQYLKYLDSETNSWLWRVGAVLDPSQTGPVGFFLPNLGLKEFSIIAQVDETQTPRASRLDVTLDIDRAYLNILKAVAGKKLTRSLFQGLKGFRNFDINLEFDTFPDLAKDKTLLKKLAEFPGYESIQEQTNAAALAAAEGDPFIPMRKVVADMLTQMSADQASWALILPFYAALYRTLDNLADVSIVFGEYIFELKFTIPGGFSQLLPDPETLPKV